MGAEGGSAEARDRVLFRSVSISEASVEGTEEGMLLILSVFFSLPMIRHLSFVFSVLSRIADLGLHTHNFMEESLDSALCCILLNQQRMDSICTKVISYC